MTGFRTSQDDPAADRGRQLASIRRRTPGEVTGSGRAWQDRRVARTWLSIRVELVEGRGRYYWPRPGRVFAAAPTHTFAQLSQAIDAAFGRWDLGHSHGFTMGDGVTIGVPDPDWGAQESLDDTGTSLGRLRIGEAFAYEFDFGDGWTHVCRVDDVAIDPVEVFGLVPDDPTPLWGGGDLPDQYGRRWIDDDGRSPGRDPEARDLPPLHPGWGARSR